MLVRFWRSFALGMMVSALLVGCESASLSQVFEDQQTFRCPQVEVIEQAASFTAFKNAEVGNLDQALYTLSFVRLTGECALEKEGELTQKINVFFVAKPEVAMPSALLAKGEWFITLLRDQGVDKQPEVLLRQTFTHEANLVRGGELVPSIERFTLSIPNVTVAEMRSLVVMGGFVLSDDEWAFQEENPFLFNR